MPPRKIDLLGLQYHGVAGSSIDCKSAVLRLLQYGPPLVRVLILTNDRRHALLLTDAHDDTFVIKTGFTSGYGGEGPNALSVCLALLDAHGAQADEKMVDKAILERLDLSGLTVGDWDQIVQAPHVRPANYPLYILERHHDAAMDGTLWRRQFETVIPLGSVDPRLADLALTFRKDPDARLMDGYRRLEEVLRKRTGLTSSGSKLFSAALSPDKGILTWVLDDDGEKQGRYNLFTGAFMALRNPRAHKVDHPSNPAAEFAMLNLLFQLESEAVARPDPGTVAPR
jgi:hypothetical protein